MGSLELARGAHIDEAGRAAGFHEVAQVGDGQDGGTLRAGGAGHDQMSSLSVVTMGRPVSAAFA